jgi:hypothetical protein
MASSKEKKEISPKQKRKDIAMIHKAQYRTVAFSAGLIALFALLFFLLDTQLGPLPVH